MPTVISIYAQSEPIYVPSEAMYAPSEPIFAQVMPQVSSDLCPKWAPGPLLRYLPRKVAKEAKKWSFPEVAPRRFSGSC